MRGSHPSRLPIARILILAAATTVFLGAGPTRAVTITAGLEGGLYLIDVNVPYGLKDLEPFVLNQLVLVRLDPKRSSFPSTVPCTSGFGSVVVDVSGEKWGATGRYLFTAYSASADFTAAVEGLDVSGLAGLAGTGQKQDLDFSVYRKFDLAEATTLPWEIALFAGGRYEYQRIEGDLLARGIAIGGKNGSSTVELTMDPPLRYPGMRYEYELFTPVAGARLVYRLAEWGLSPFVQGAVFPYAIVRMSFEFTEGDVAGVATVPALDDEQGFGGFAASAGIALSCEAFLKIPASATLSYRYQEIERTSFGERVQQASLGLFYSF